MVDKPEVRDELEQRRLKKAQESAKADAIASALQAVRGVPFRTGENVHCTVVASEPGGYEVMVKDVGRDGFLSTASKLQPGDEVVAQYVCASDEGLLLLSYRSSDGEGGSTASAAIAGIVLRRAIDILPPRPSDDCLTIFPTPLSAKAVIQFVERFRQTGVLRVTSEERTARAAALLCDGRVVGCLYGDPLHVESPRTDEALDLLLQVLAVKSTEAEFYRLDEAVILSMCSLFIGYPMDRNDSLDAPQYFEHIQEWLKTNSETACVAISFTDGATGLVMFHQGRFVRYFHIQQQLWSDDISEVIAALQADPKAKVSTSIMDRAPGSHFGIRMSSR